MNSIIFIIGGMQRDGAERVISILADDFLKRNWEIYIITLLNENIEYDIDDRINIISLCGKNTSYLMRTLYWIFNLRKKIKKIKPAIMVSFVARINVLSLIATIGIKCRKVISERNDPIFDGRSIVTRYATFITYQMADCIIFQTKRAQNCFPSSIRKKSTIILNPVVVQTKALSPAKRNKKIVNVGRLAKQKNQKLLIEAFRMVYEKFPEYKLYIYGKGSLEAELKLLTERSGLENAVLFPGSYMDIHYKISDAQLFVLSSDYEGLSNALMEAMMMGLPCISTECAGSDEIINSGENGVLVPVGNKDELARAMIELIENEEKRNRIGLEAIASSEFFSEQNIICEWRRAIENTTICSCDGGD